VFNCRVNNQSSVQVFEFADRTFSLSGLMSFRQLGTAQSDTMLGTELDDYLDGLGGNDLLQGVDGDDTLLGGAGNDTLDGGTGSDKLTGGIGNDRYIVDGTWDQLTELANEGVDTVVAPETWTLADHFENLELLGSSGLQGTGNAADNLIVGNSVANTLRGLAGNDTLDGGSGADSLEGGTGDDRYLVDVAGDRVVEAANAGTDTVASAITYTLGSNVENLELTGTTAINGTGNTLANQLTGNGAANRLDGGAGADTLAGGAGDDTYVVDNTGDVVNEAAASGTDLVEASISYTLGNDVERLTLMGTGPINGTGNALANTLNGNAGNNRLDGAAGADTMVGGAGNDTYVVDNAADVVTEVAAGGTDAVESSISYTLGAEVERLTLTGTAALNGTGNALANQITGNAGSNVLNGGAGVDTMVGGAGDDTYVVDAVGEVTTEVAGGGIDTVEASLSWTLANEIENLKLMGTGVIDATGNGLANTLTGNSANNRLNGGAGADTMAGGAGNDTYVVDNAGDVVTEAAAGGTDLVEASVSYTLSSDVENLTLTLTGAINGTGNAGANTLIGNAGNNRLDGAAGADTMTGGAGDDTYVVDNAGDVVTEAASGGADRVEASISYTLGAELERLTLTGTAALNGTGNALANQITGNAGNNILNGGAGNDTMAGGAGDDTYVLDVTTDVVTENANEGTDTVQIGLTYTLGNNVENLVLTGTNAINGTGNTLANSLTGNGAANRLDGGAGIDTMAGGAGDDVYVVENVADVVTELAGGGLDTVEAAVSYTLGAEVERLTLTGTGPTNATGNALANTLTGNAGNNRLDGGVGIDTMTGGAGNDTYVVDNLADVVTEAAGAGTDTVEASVSITALAAEVENLVLLGTGALNGTGNTLNNVLTGNDGANVLNGGAGNDTMVGGAGDDSYVVDVSTDVITELAGGGTDSVSSAVTYTLAANVENLTLTGNTAINGTGNAADNVLTGNSGANVLTGGEGNDIYIGGAGVDTLTDTSTMSNDVYRWGAGQGNDVITDAGGTDRIEIAGAFTTTQVQLTRATNDLRITVSGVADVLTVKNWYTNAANRIETIRLDNGSVITLGTVAPASAPLASPAALTTTAMVRGDDEPLRRFTQEAPDGDRFMVSTAARTPRAHGDVTRSLWTELLYSTELEASQPVDAVSVFVAPQEEVVVGIPVRPDVGKPGRIQDGSASGVGAGTLNRWPEWSNAALWQDLATEDGMGPKRLTDASPSDRTAQLLIDALAQFNAGASIGELGRQAERREALRHDLFVPH
jgi:trimeric autotransporter adhesin